MIRALWFYPAAAALTLVLASRLVVASWLRRPSLPKLCRRLGRQWARTILRWSGVRVSFEGLDEVEWDEPMVLVANHQSWFDVFALAGELPVVPRFVVKKELARIPVFGRAWQDCGHIAVDRSDRSRAIASLRDVGDSIEEESLALLFFPEGTRSRDGRLQPFKKGAFVLAIQNQVPVVPMAIVGSRAVMPKGSFRIRPGHIRIRVGEPIPTRGLVHTDRNRLMQKGREAVLQLKAADRTFADEADSVDGVSNQPKPGKQS